MQARRNRSKNTLSNRPNQTIKSEISISKSECFSGPLPHPETMAKYEGILPGAADRIIIMAEKQSDHRMSCEKYYLDKSMRQSVLGQVFAFTICLAGIVGGVVLLALNKNIGGFAALIGSLGLLAGVFFSVKKEAYKRIQEKKENDSQ